MENIVFYPTKFDGYYASKDGDIYSAYSKKCLSPKYDKDGYCEYALTIHPTGELKYIRGHRLIADTFLENLDNKETVNHKNGNKSDNRVENLEWATYSENNLHRYRVLHTKAPLKWNIDIYHRGILEYENVSLTDCIDAGFSGKYLRTIQKEEFNTYFMFFEKTENKQVLAYWNGEILYRYSSPKEASEQLGIRLNCLYHRMKEHKDVEYIARDYKFVIKKIENKKGVTTKLV